MFELEVYKTIKGLWISNEKNKEGNPLLVLNEKNIIKKNEKCIECNLPPYCSYNIVLQDANRGIINILDF